MTLLVLLLLIALNVIDGIQTVRALRTSGYSEMNPVGRWIFNRLGVALGTTVYKTAFISFFTGSCFLFPQYALYALLPLAALGLFAVTHNYLEMNK